MMIELLNYYFEFNNSNILFVLIGMLLTILSLSSAKSYIQKQKKWYILLNIIYILSFSLLIFTSNWFVFIIGWELVTVTTSLMLLWANKKNARQYFILQFVGSSILIYAILLAICNGYKEISIIDNLWLQNLFIIGMGMKSAVFPLHFWLAPIHSQAPAPVSAILSGWVVKLGFITYLKLIPDGNNLLLILGIIMIFWGGYKALYSSDYKVLLAYSTISQLGYIALGIGSGNYYAQLASIFHIIAHGLAKTALFINSAYWAKEYGTRIIYRFKMPWQKQRLLSIFTIISFLSLSGIPILAGFNSKYLLKHALHNNIVLIIILHLSGIITLLYVLRFFYWTFKFESPAESLSEIKENYSLKLFDKISQFPVLILLIVIGIFPGSIIYSGAFKSLEFNFFSGLLYYFLYFLISILILKRFKWIKTPEKALPSLDRMMRRLYKYIYYFSKKSRKYNPEIFFESYLYKWFFNGSRCVYELIYKDFQSQLLWIPIFFIFVLGWATLRII